jgi:hypothetical protein
LIRGSKQLECNNLTIITYDQEKEEIIKEKKIKLISLWKWFFKDDEKNTKKADLILKQYLNNEIKIIIPDKKSSVVGIGNAIVDVLANSLKRDNFK